MQKVTECLILFERSYCVFVPQGFVTKCFLIFIVDEVKNFAANNLLQVGELVTYWEPCIIGQSCTEIRAKGWRSYIEEFRGSEAVEGCYCKFIYGDCRVSRKRFCTRSETYLYYSKLLFRKVSPQVFYYETSLFHWFSWVIIHCLIYFSAAFIFHMILMFICFNKFYS